MKKLTFALVSLVASATAVWAQAAKYPPLSEYMMAQDAEVALAKSAAPAGVSGHATIEILTTSGYKIVTQGDNGFVCMVMRGWSAPTFTPAAFRELVYDPKVRAPICFDPVASRTVLPYYELRTKLGIQGNDPEAITRAVAMAYALGELPKRESVYTNAMLGGNQFGAAAPQVSDDAGTPFTVVVIPVEGDSAAWPTTHGKN